MRDLAILSFVTLDGVMQAPKMPQEDKSGGFRHGGWAVPYWDEVMDQVRAEARAEPYDVVFGRRTYDLFAACATAQHPMNKAKKIVATSSPQTLAWQNTSPITGDIAQEVMRLKQADGPLLQVHGSSELLQTLLAQDLVDELRLWTFPVSVGCGKRLFGHDTGLANFQLKKVDATSNGVVMTIYRRKA